MRIPAANLRPAIEAAQAAIDQRLRALHERSFYILGPESAAFENEFAGFTGAPYVVTCGNGTAAIELCLREAGLSHTGARVLAPALTAPFTAVGIMGSGCRPVFADVDEDTLQIDPDDAGNRLGRRVKMLVAVHLYGQPAPLRALRRLGVPLLQDGAQAHGARYQGQPLTRFSDYVTYSFYPTKNLGALGDGGAIATPRKSKADRLRQMRDGGRRGGQVSYLPGINSRLDEMQACYLRAFLPRLGEWNAWRARVAAVYDQALRDCPGVRLVRRTADSVHHLYVIRAARRDKLRAFLASKGIGTGVHYPVPLHLHPAFRDAGQKRGSLPRAEKAAREVLSLPLWPYLPLSQAEEVAAAVRAFF